jgi:hypothetical protein
MRRCWEPGQDAAGDGNLSFGGWIWRYDIRSVGSSEAHVTLTYDWSAVSPELREHIQFPPFDPAHLENSLKHLADLATTQIAGWVQRRVHQSGVRVGPDELYRRGVVELWRVIA